MFKKHALSLSEGSIQQGRSHFDARSVLIVREHGKMARTPLAAFSNIPIRGVCAVLAPCQTGVSSPKQAKLFLREPYAWECQIQILYDTFSRTEILAGILCCLKGKRHLTEGDWCVILRQ